MRILTVLGARPQFVKAAMVSDAIRLWNVGEGRRRIDEVIVHTGQHFDASMSKVFFEQLELPQPRYDLGIAGLPHGAMTGRMLERIEAVISDELPSCVLVYGDTNSTLAAALAAAKMAVPVAHVEAGLRSHNMRMPEELNRVLADRVSSVLFCPTPVALQNLKSEGYPFRDTRGCAQRIEHTGDVMFDAVLRLRRVAQERVQLDTWGVLEGQYVLCTIHRQENTDEATRLRSILDGLRRIALECPVVLPLHPRARMRIDALTGKPELTGIRVVEPLPYLEMQRLVMSARCVLTDSGGLQKEAFFHSVPCITLRDETEWEETLRDGWNQLVGADGDRMVLAFRALERPHNAATSVYGDGHSAESIVRILADEFAA